MKNARRKSQSLDLNTTHKDATDGALTNEEERLAQKVCKKGMEC